ncbi:unnamed protein product [Periconia digitata]|uniref:Uncharacterized protein n=1 Tax=Periconia digitata TaxID=1303443 RepID=A0A9W4UMD8_9PLEO|nr:unnamed protein product [Periconia digitata]
MPILQTLKGSTLPSQHRLSPPLRPNRIPEHTAKRCILDSATPERLVRRACTGPFTCFSAQTEVNFCAHLSCKRQYFPMATTIASQHHRSKSNNMPGLFTPSPHTNERKNLRANIFEPAPQYGFAARTSGHQVTGDANAHEARLSDQPFNFSAPASNAFSTTPSWPRSSKHAPSFDAKSPPPLANDRYQLAGGMHTPIVGGSKRLHGDYDDYFNLEQQRGMWASPATPYTRMQQADHLQPSPSTSKPWVLNQIFNIVGGVAGKLAQFCTVPFRGFSAGGGQAYTFEADGRVAAQLFHDPPAADPIEQHAPGHFPSEDNFGVRSIDSIDSERPRMPKRLRTADSWVVVDKDGTTESRPSSPRLTERRVPAHSRSPSQIPRPVSRANISTPIANRPSLIPVSRRSTLDRNSIQLASKPDSQTRTHERSYSRQSYGSPVMFEAKAAKSKISLPPESHRLINKVRREEFEDDQRLRRMSSQMSTMLREAQEALGSKFELQDDFMDDGYDDDR